MGGDIIAKAQRRKDAEEENVVLCILLKDSLYASAPLPERGFGGH
jgi:hypothetical protein